MKNNKLMRWLISLLTMLPLFAVGVMSLYTIFNKNAYLSYSDNYVSQIVSLPNGTEYNDGQTYYLTYYETNGSTSEYTRISYSDISIDWNEILGVSTDFSNVNCVYLRGDGQIYLYYLNNSTNAQSYIYGASNVWGNTLNTFYCTYLDNYLFTTFSYSGQAKLETYTYVTDKLDNAFEYSMSKFNDLGFDKVNFVGLFDDLFNTQSNVYTIFINCYLNYLMFVAVVTFIPRILYWFVNFGFRLVDRFSNYKGGW